MQAKFPAIQIRDVWKAYDESPDFAIRGVTLDIAPGEFLALIGASGSGKTTLLKFINRLIVPTRGSIVIDGVDAAVQDAVQLRRRIGYVFQSVGLFPHMTVAENIAVTLRLLGKDKAEIAMRTTELLDLVRLPRELGTRFPATLSGGQSQRVGVARALAAHPKIMLMDEPFGAVDPVTRDALARDYRALHDRLGLTTIMVTHDVLEALILADRIAVIDGGMVAACGSPEEMLARAEPASVRDLMDMPRRQADRVRSLATGNGAA